MFAENRCPLPATTVTPLASRTLSMKITRYNALPSPSSPSSLISSTFFSFSSRYFHYNSTNGICFRTKLKCSSFVESKIRGSNSRIENWWNRTRSLSLLPFIRLVSLYIPYLQHFEPSLLSVNWFQTLSPNGISGISIRSHLVKPGHKTRGTVCVSRYLDTYIYILSSRVHKNQFILHSLRIAINFSNYYYFRASTFILVVSNRIEFWIHHAEF